MYASENAYVYFEFKHSHTHKTKKQLYCFFFKVSLLIKLVDKYDENREFKWMYWLLIVFPKICKFNNKSNKLFNFFMQILFQVL